MLFKNTLKLQEYAEITTATNFATVKPSIRRIEKNHVIPILGTTLYNSLNTAYTLVTDESTLTAAQQYLLDACREAIGPLLGYYFAPIGEIKMSDAGLRRSETANEKTGYQYQITNFREACLKNGESAIEDLLRFLEENKASYTEWTSSAEFANYRSLFIKTGSEFQQLFPSHSPYRNYWAMRQKMVDVEEKSIRTAITSPVFDALKAKDKLLTDTFTDKEKELLFQLKKAIAYFSVSFSVPFLSIRIDTNGITVSKAGASISRDQDATRNAAADNDISSLIRSCNDAGQQWLKDSIIFIKNNATDFPQWIVETTSTIDCRKVNADLGGSFGLI